MEYGYGDIYSMSKCEYILFYVYDCFVFCKYNIHNIYRYTIYGIYIHINTHKHHLNLNNNVTIKVYICTR